ncbi:MAG: MraY family glycosyltransferase, partial [Thermodesulfobacteriota bacterium]
MIYLSSFLLAFYLTVILVPLSSRLGNRFGAVDDPNTRKVHDYPIPKTGGIALTIGILVPLWFWVPLDREFKAFLSGAAIIFVFGLLDDLFHLDYKKKFLGQFLAVTLTMIMGKFSISTLGMWWSASEVLVPPWMGIPLTVLFLLGITNAINLADGLDGLAGGICILIFSCLGLLAYDQNNTNIVLSSLIIIGALLGFLRYNTFPATVFMGDTGSQLLGFSAGIFSLYLTQDHNSPISRVLPVLILGFPILDTLTVMAKRFIEGRPLFKADKRHFHHLLLKFGASHVASVACIYILQGIMVGLSIYFRYYPESWAFMAYLIMVIPILLFFMFAARFGLSLGVIFGWGESLEQIIVTGKTGKNLVKWPLAALRIGLPVGLTWLALSSSLLFQKEWEWALFWVLGLLILLSSWLYKPAHPHLIRFSLYLLGFYLLFSTQGRTLAFLPLDTRTFNFIFWGSMAFFLAAYLLMSKFKDLEVSSLDYLLLLLVALVPALPLEVVQHYQLGMIAFAMVILLW